ncbi:hypothetical protein [Gemmatimonas sp.]|uniref:hypothetical protein n=1 Tax=Gemmatimonas sp. TaxID=1962908 RepID=UPI003DA4DE84
MGRNGAGKSSIFSVITGDRQPNVGAVARKPGMRHALLDQHRAFEGATTGVAGGRGGVARGDRPRAEHRRSGDEAGRVGGQGHRRDAREVRARSGALRRYGRLRVSRPRGCRVAGSWLRRRGVQNAARVDAVGW